MKVVRNYNFKGYDIFERSGRSMVQRALPHLVNSFEEKKSQETYKKYKPILADVGGLCFIL